MPTKCFLKQNAGELETCIKCCACARERERESHRYQGEHEVQKIQTKDAFKKMLFKDAATKKCQPKKMHSKKDAFFNVFRLKRSNSNYCIKSRRQVNGQKKKIAEQKKMKKDEKGGVS